MMRSSLSLTGRSSFSLACVRVFTNHNADFINNKFCNQSQMNLMNHSSISSTTVFAKRFAAISARKKDNSKPKILKRSSVIKELQALFLLSEDQCCVLLRSPALLQVEDRVLVDNARLLHENGIAGSQLLRVPSILKLETEILKAKLSLILSGENMFTSPSDGLGFCNYSLPSIRKYRNNFFDERLSVPHHRNRIYLMADMLQVPVAEMTEAVVHPQRLCYMLLGNIKSVIQMINKHQIKGSQVLRDPWLLSHNMSLSEDQLEEFYHQHPHQPRVWSATSAPTQQHDPEITKTAYSASEELCPSTPPPAIHPDTPLAYDIANKIGCSHEYVANLLKNDKKIKASPTKVVKMIDLLLQEGYTLAQILRCPRLFNHSLKRISSRLKIMRDAGLKSPFLTILTVQQSHFELNYNMMLEEKKALDRERAALELSPHDDNSINSNKDELGNSHDGDNGS